MSLFGGVFGDAKDADPTRAPNMLADISRQLLDETAGLRGNLVNRYTGMTSLGGISPEEQRELSILQGLKLDSQNGGFFDEEGYTRALSDLKGSSPMVWSDTMDSNVRQRIDPAAVAALRSSFDRRPASLTDAQQERLSFLEERLSNPTAPGTSLSSQIHSSPQFASLKDAIDRQFSMAKKNLLGTTPAGGALTSSLANLEGQRAGNMASGFGDLAEREMARAFALGTGQTPIALSGLGSAAGSLGQIQAAQAQQQSATTQALGYGAGRLMASNKGGSAAAGSSSAGSKAGSAAAAV